MRRYQRRETNAAKEEVAQGPRKIPHARRMQIVVTVSAIIIAIWIRSSASTADGRLKGSTKLAKCPRIRPSMDSAPQTTLTGQKFAVILAGLDTDKIDSGGCRLWCSDCCMFQYLRVLRVEEDSDTREGRGCNNAA